MRRLQDLHSVGPEALQVSPYVRLVLEEGGAPLGVQPALDGGASLGGSPLSKLASSSRPI